MKWKGVFVTRLYNSIRKCQTAMKKGVFHAEHIEWKICCFSMIYRMQSSKQHQNKQKSIESSRQMLHQSIDHQWRMNSQERHIYWREKSCGMWQDVRCRRCSESLKNAPSLLQTVLLNFVRSGLCVVLSWTLSLTQSYHPPLYPMIKHFVRTSSVMRILLFCR